MESISLSLELPVKAATLYDDWLNTEKHTAFTGGDALVKPIVGAVHTAWDSYISGKILALEEGKRILMTWRTLEFIDGTEDSTVELLFETSNEGCKLTLNHTNLAEGDGDKYGKGWEEHYFEPMRKYYL
jgi:activator of HSP90 ATPase